MWASTARENQVLYCQNLSFASVTLNSLSHGTGRKERGRVQVSLVGEIYA